MGARRFDELIAWQLGMRLQAFVVDFCERPAVKDDFKYCAQLKDAGSGICRNIAEGFGRWTHPDFHNSLRIAMTCHKETESLLNEAVIRRFLSDAERRAAGPLIGRCGKAIAALMKSLRNSETPGNHTSQWKRTRTVANRKTRGSRGTRAAAKGTR